MTLRKEERRELRKLERELNKKQKDKEELRVKLATIANHSIMIKSEKRKLRQAEINQFKLEQDVDRKFETGKIIKRHQQLEDQLHSKFIIQLIIVLGKRKDMTDYLKLIENERKNKMINDYNERKTSNERRVAAELEVLKNEEKRKKTKEATDN